MEIRRLRDDETELLKDFLYEAIYIPEGMQPPERSIPYAEERISWSMPTFWKGRNIIHFAAFKKHIGLYPGDEAIEAFTDQLDGYAVSKGTIRLSYSQELPEMLIGGIARWCYTHYRK